MQWKVQALQTPMQPQVTSPCPTRTISASITRPYLGGWQPSDGLHCTNMAIIIRPLTTRTVLLAKSPSIYMPLQSVCTTKTNTHMSSLIAGLAL
ncbi:4-aminobutyrate aminotransferase or related aminotransferase [Pseudomonas syringae pv. actinidiae]|uniref:4-aminobutyrate aminotransferase or related aminotransferase n=1 Tax=Pseudomonas syringae pv. actinidiae TaxID=103796 RepID=A0AAN4Q071_PSESF|nr:4-aminobutyrate aminotransferase or related aminotransferase [Pseudomonas syringae pv. actinidiae]